MKVRMVLNWQEAAVTARSYDSCLLLMLHSTIENNSGAP